MKIYLIAGEASGDVLGARLMVALAALAPAPLQFFGIGGDNMHAAGLPQSLFPMEELSLMGIAEVAPKIIKISKRIDETVEDILGTQPDVLVTIDAPDFCFRVARSVKDKAEKPPVMIHYVAPSVWAWRPGRAKKISAFLDGLLCLLPFEPPYFEKEGLDSIFVGHPMIETGILEAHPNSFRSEYGVPPGAAVLGVLPGSRRGELRKTGMVLFEAARKVAAAHPGLHIVIPTLPHLREEIADLFPGSGGRVHLVTVQGAQKWDAFAACDVAMATSGTVGLELAVCGVPHVIGYRVNRLTYEIARRLIRTEFAHLANIIMCRGLVPEFIQDACTAEGIAASVNGLLADPALRKAQLLAFDTVREKIGARSSASPSEKAARFIFAKAGC